MKRLLTILILFISVCSNGQPNFFWSHNSPMRLPAETQVAISANWTGIGMSLDGQIQAACIQDGLVYRSSNYGASWSSISTGNKRWNDIAVSGDGLVIVGCEKPTDVTGLLYKYESGSWTTLISVDVAQWNDVAISQTGTYILAAAMDNIVKKSADSGSTWTTFTTSGASFTDCTMSQSGQYMAYCSVSETVFNGYIYVSTNYGVSWTKLTSYPALWNDIAISDDGQIIIGVTSDGFTYSFNNYGGTLISSVETPLVNWRGIDMSTDGQYSIKAGANDSFYGTSDKTNWINLSNTARNWNDIAISSTGLKKSACVFGGYIYTFND